VAAPVERLAARDQAPSVRQKASGNAVAVLLL
jgi:hypothetical protein